APRELSRLRARPGPAHRHSAQNPRIEILHDARTGRMDLVSLGFATKEPESQRVHELQLMELGKRDRFAGAADETRHAGRPGFGHVERHEDTRVQPYGHCRSARASI